MPVKESDRRRTAEDESCSLRRFDIFNDVADEDIPLLEKRVRAVEVRKGAVYQPSGGLKKGLLFIAHGGLRLCRVTAGGRMLEIAQVRAGTFVVTQRLREAQAEAVEDTLLCVIGEDDLEWMVLEHPQVALRLLPVLIKRLVDSDSRLEALAFWPVKARVARALLALEDQGAVAGMTHQELGDIVGSTRETVTVILNELARDGIVELAHGRIRILEPDRLHALSHD